MKREYKLFIQDILDAIRDIERFVGTMDFNEFSNDEKTRSDVVWKIEVIGEATKNIPKDIRAKYANLPWKEMAKMRDKIAHFYFGIDNNIVWKVVKNRLPEIMPKVERMLAELQGEETIEQ